MQILGVHVYLLSLEKAPADPSGFGALLDDGERAEAASFSLMDRGRRFMIGRAALRSLLSAHNAGSVTETAWRFGRSKNGKPFVRSPETQAPFFNLSHAGDLIAIAISNAVKVGIDIEAGQAFPPEEIPWHLFSEGEQRHLRAAAPQDFWHAFMRLWTLKEAIAKRIGTGFSTAFSAIDTTVLPVVDGLDGMTSHAQAEPALCHLCLTIPEGTVHLSLSTAPAA